MHTAVFILHLRVASELFRASLFFLLFLKSTWSTGYDAFASASAFLLLKRSRMLLSMQSRRFYLIHALPRSERSQKMKERKVKNEHDEPKTNVYMYKVMYTIYSNTFQNRQTLKSLAKISISFFSQPIRKSSRLYNICIWVIMRDQSNKNKYFFAMSPFKVVYLCTFISIFLSLLWMVERVFNKQAYCAQCGNSFFFSSSSTSLP